MTDADPAAATNGPMSEADETAAIQKRCDEVTDEMAPFIALQNGSEKRNAPVTLIINLQRLSEVCQISIHRCDEWKLHKRRICGHGVWWFLQRAHLTYKTPRKALPAAAFKSRSICMTTSSTFSTTASVISYSVHVSWSWG
uniref:Uncharacterized protein n=1 Tax=Branchiostoma floridae TaxID=7739 RepID=C3XS10_BRAFL|eukprot:XP_002613469.1 hypothetical protein BRAFLDRAFT_71928 [Branchiostoma floridae]